MKTLSKLTLSVLVTMTMTTSNLAFANYAAGLDSFPTWPAKGLSKFEPEIGNATFPTRFENHLLFRDFVKKPTQKKGQ